MILYLHKAIYQPYDIMSIVKPQKSVPITQNNDIYGCRRLTISILLFYDKVFLGKKEGNK